MSTETTPRDRQTTGGMERVTFRETESKIDALDALVNAGQFPNRSEAIRAAIGQLVASESVSESDA